MLCCIFIDVYDFDLICGSLRLHPNTRKTNRKVTTGGPRGTTQTRSRKPDGTRTLLYLEEDSISVVFEYNRSTFVLLWFSVIFHLFIVRIYHIRHIKMQDLQISHIWHFFVSLKKNAHYEISEQTKSNVKWEVRMEVIVKIKDYVYTKHKFTSYCIYKIHFVFF